MPIYDAEARIQYKKQARVNLALRFWPAMAASLLELIPLGLISIIYQVGMPDTTEMITAQEITQIYKMLGIYLAFMLFIGVPVQYGAKRYFIACAREERASASLVFSSFASGKQYWTSIKIVLCIIVRSLGWIALLIVYFVAVVLFIMFDNWALFVLGLVLAIPLSLLVAVKIRRFDGAYIHMIDEPDGSVMKAINACATTFRKHNWELFVFDLTFVFWHILSAITLGIVGIYVNAYTETAFVNYFDALCGRKHRSEEETDTPEISE